MNLDNPTYKQYKTTESIASTFKSTQEYILYG